MRESRTIRVSGEIKQRLDAYCQARHMVRSRVVDDALRDYLRKLEESNHVADMEIRR